MLNVVCWKWGRLFSATYVNRLKLALRKHLQVDHQLTCVTDDPTGIDNDVRLLPIREFTDTPRCRRRLKQFDKYFAKAMLGQRILTIDLDVVLTGDITALVDRPEPLVCWKVGYARVFSGSFILYDHDVLHGLYEAYQADPDGYPTSVQSRGVPSDQAMLNHYVDAHHIPVAQWTEADGFVCYFGDGYERFEHLGVGPGQPTLPLGARIVVLGSADKAAMDEGRFDWIREHWSSLEKEGVRQ